MNPEILILENAKCTIEREYALIVKISGRKTDGSWEMITLQRALSEEDDVPGEEGIYFERGDQQYAAYGVVEHCSLQEDELRIVIDEDSSARFGEVREWRFCLRLSAAEREQFVDALLFVFRDCEEMLSLDEA